MVTGMCRSVPKSIYSINDNIRQLLCKIHRLLMKNVKLTGTFSIKKATKMENCGIGNGGMGHKFALELLLVAI